MERNFTARLQEVLEERPGVEHAIDTLAERARMQQVLVGLRKTKGLTQQDLADAAGWKQSAVARFENNPRPSRVKVNSLVQYARACDVEIGVFFFSRQGDDVQVESVVSLSSGVELPAKSMTDVEERLQSEMIAASSPARAVG